MVLKFDCKVVLLLLATVPAVAVSNKLSSAVVEVKSVVPSFNVPWLLFRSSYSGTTIFIEPKPEVIEPFKTPTLVTAELPFK